MCFDEHVCELAQVQRLGSQLGRLWSAVLLGLQLQPLLGLKDMEKLISRDEMTHNESGTGTASYDIGGHVTLILQR